MTVHNKFLTTCIGEEIYLINQELDGSVPIFCAPSISKSLLWKYNYPLD